MTAWHSLLAPTLIDDLRRSLPLAAQRTGGVTLGETVAAPLGDSVGYCVSGRDAAKFLQGQLTCDVTAVDAAHSRSACWCSVKGRVRTTLRLLTAAGSGDGTGTDSAEGGYQVLLPGDHAGDIMQQLQRFVLRSKVAIEPLPDQLTLGIGGNHATDWLHSRFGSVPTAVNAVFAADGVQVVRLPQITTATSTPRFLLSAKQPAMAPLWRAASAAFTPIAPSAWRLLELLSGVITVNAALSDQYLPQMLHLDHGEGVSYTKGCYIGQEIVARTHHLGRLKRCAFTAHIATAGAVQHADAIYASSGAVVGSVIAAAKLTADNVLAQLLLRIDQAHSADLRLVSPGGAPITVMDAPPAGEELPSAAD